MTVSGKTGLLGLLGWPVSHSFSPVMHNAAAQAAGVDVVYIGLPLRPELVGDGIRGLAALGFRGVNVTVPHKQAVMPFLDEVDVAAQAIGAVNTILFEDGSGKGYNTDWSGFLADLDGLGTSAEMRDCLVLGAGGSARAVVYGLLQRHARVHVLARRKSQAEALVQSFASTVVAPATMQAHAIDRLPQLEVTRPLIINTTPLGMWPQVDGCVWPLDLPMPDGAFVYDLVYNPADTSLTKLARAGGASAASGLGMLLHQGAQAFELWTGVSPDLAVMRRAIGF